MDISYKGGNSLVFATKKTTVLVDPKVSDLGLKDPAVGGAVEIVTDERFAIGTMGGDNGARLIIDGPGEYEVGDFSIRGVAARRHTDETGLFATIYRLETSELRIGVLGNVENKLSDDQLEALGVVDILVIPVGGNGYTLDPHDAAALTRQIDPKAVIPVHYEDGGVKYEVPQLGLDAFTRELNLPIESVDKYKIKNSGALPDTLSVIALKRG